MDGGGVSKSPHGWEYNKIHILLTVYPSILTVSLHEIDHRSTN